MSVGKRDTSDRNARSRLGVDGRSPGQEEGPGDTLGPHMDERNLSDRPGHQCAITVNGQIMLPCEHSGPEDLSVQPQMDGLVERFNRILKIMLRKFVGDDPQHRDILLPAILFTVWEIHQASLGFFPFELLYGREPRSILDFLRETGRNKKHGPQGWPAMY